MFNTLGFRWEDDLHVNPDKFHVIAEHHIRYLVPVRGEGELCIQLAPTHLGQSSCIVKARVESIDGATLYAEGTTRIVRLDPATSRPCAWSARFRDAMAPLVAVPAAAAVV